MYMFDVYYTLLVVNVAINFRDCAYERHELQILLCMRWLASIRDDRTCPQVSRF